MIKTKVHIAALLAMLFWGFSFIWSKMVFEQYSPLSTIFFRLIISSLFLFLLMLLTGRFELPRKNDLWLFLVSSLFNPFLYFIGENYGLERVSASVSAFIIATIPVFTPFVAYRVFGERLSKTNITGLVFAFVGVVLIILGPDLTIAASPAGIGFLMMAVLAAVVYSVFLKKLSMKYRAVTVISWQNLIGMIYFLPFFVLVDMNDVMQIQPQPRTIYSLIMLGILASSLAFVLFTYVIRHIGISKGNLYANLVPVFASIAAFFILQEKYTLLRLGGMSLIILGVVLSELERKNGLAGKQKNKFL